MEETKEMFPDLDTDKDGAIKWQEYVEDNYGVDFSEDSEEFKNPQSVEWEEFVSTYNKEKKKWVNVQMVRMKMYLNLLWSLNAVSNASLCPAH